MAFNKAPQSFFGTAGYSLAANVLSLNTADNVSGSNSGGIFTLAVDGVITTTTAHSLSVADRVHVATTVGDLTAGRYWVKTVEDPTSLKLSATKDGAALTFSGIATSAAALVLTGPIDELSSANANATSGDWRKCVSGIMEMLYHKWLKTPTVDRPSRVSITKTFGTLNGATTATYTVRITFATPSADAIADE